ncbi:4266_t:CDS:2 [Acaulospora colombiana]|uniref:4266_t:CDS:1 n=1 Tax=Acaulospora colombiana TaxID=27376 RepID=A0ACA9MHE4_9GLOM|nr:4266_t:CDS:2 [Acaulospora colombiana]
MGSIVKVNIVAALLFAFTSIFVAAGMYQFSGVVLDVFVFLVLTVNSPLGFISNGVVYNITWTQSGSEPSGTCALYIINANNSARTTITTSADIASGSYSWKVNVPAGYYYFAINDGTGERDSGDFQVTGGSSSASAGPNTPASSGQSTAASGPSPTETNAAVTTANGGETATNGGSTNTATGSSSTSTNSR